MTRLATAFAAPRPALVTFVAEGGGPPPTMIDALAEARQTKLDGAKARAASA
ncbi:MAG: hypothetical protein K2X73_02825 [Sphingomonas sp.]|uniref:hypothetical protein n=1 Tax=Sphingomonas sp. TaxID=28214 RepID=UPI0025F3B710|nr:hypothetical protein [Sphingomonas sp.]MBX9880886.1 hypothetical protein [Sphingomonas sp.]